MTTHGDFLIQTGGFDTSAETMGDAMRRMAFAGCAFEFDTIEQALREAGRPLDGPEGYVVACRLAADNLRLGSPVVVDSVNPLAITRVAYREVAARAGVTQADEDAAGPPAVVFATMARKMREAAGTLMSQGPRAMRRDAAALDMLAALCEGESLTWAEVRS